MQAPVVQLDTVEVITGHEMAVICTVSGNGETAAVHALLQSLPIASLAWDIDVGYIQQVYVRPEWRRQGVASMLLAAAKELAADQGWGRPLHSLHRTPAGHAWAKATGGEGAVDQDVQIEDQWEYAGALADPDAAE